MPLRPPWVAGLLLVLAVGACGGGNDGSAGPSGGTGASPATSGSGDSPGASGSGTAGGAGSPGASQDLASPAASDGTSPAPASGDAGTFTNPVLERNFADPFVLEHEGTYYAYATGDLTVNIQLSTSTDLVDWTARREALPRLPFWQPSSKGLTWAPEVVETSAGFVLHYTGRDVQSGRQCLAVAVAESPEGPFVDESDEPLVCQEDLGGSIDSHPFQDEDGSRYLLWKSDGNCCGLPVRMYIQPMAEDGLTLEGEAQALEGIEVDAPWERTLVEAPTLWVHEGTYYLFYSANDYGSRNYAVAYATADDVLGPYEDAEENPILQTKAEPGSPPGEAAGPGHQSIVVDKDGDLWMVYHAWDSNRIGDQIGGRRSLWIDELEFDEEGRAVVLGPDSSPQPVP